MPISFNILPAGSGDAILINADEFHMLIDSGDGTRVSYLERELNKIRHRNQTIHLMILTHPDHDHIKGFINILKNHDLKQLVQEVWINTFSSLRVEPIQALTTISKLQLITLEKLIHEAKKENSSISLKKEIYSEKYTQPVSINKNINIQLLSPTLKNLERSYEKYNNEKKRTNNIKGKIPDYQSSIESLAKNKFSSDTSPSNGASIAFILSYKKHHQFLFLADAHINIITHALKKLGFSKQNPLQVEFVKLSHHGSKHNLNSDFLHLIKTKKFIISSQYNGTNKHPDKETLSKIIMHCQSENINFFFNYNNTFHNQKDFIHNQKIFSTEEQEEYNFQLHLANKNSLTFG